MLMDIQIKGTKYEPTPEVIRHATKQMSGLKKFFRHESGEVRAYLELERAVGSMQKGDVWRAELNVDVGGERYRAESTKVKLDHAITTAVHDVSRELARAKKKDHDFVRKGGAAVKSFLRGFKK